MAEKARKIRILYTLSELMFGSKTRRLIDTIKHLDRSRFEPAIAVTYLGDEATDEIKALNVPLWQWNFFPVNDTFRLRNMVQFFCSPLFLRRNDFDIVHSFQYNSLFTEAFFCRVSRSKYIYTKSNLQWGNHSCQWRLKSNFADRIIAQSHAGLHLLHEKGFSGKSTLIHTGVDIDRFAPAGTAEKQRSRQSLGIPDKAFVIGYAAQFIKVKDHLTLVRAISRLSRGHENVYLLLCGDNYNDSYYHEIQQQVEREGLSKNTIELGSTNKMEQFYAACDCIAYPSIFENFSIVILEAMSSGLPVVASRFGGNIDQIQHDKNGFLAEAGSDEEFANYLKIYLENDETLRDHSRQCRRTAVDKFSVRHSVGRLEQEYLEALSSFQ